MLSAILFSIGVYGVLARRNAVLILMSVELMLNAVSINMVAFAVYTAPSLFVGIIFAIFVITIAAAEVGLALGDRAARLPEPRDRERRRGRHAQVVSARSRASGADTRGSSDQRIRHG